MGYSKNGLPDTPWHIGFIKKDEDDNRRHMARCIHRIDGICKCEKSEYFALKCGGSAHCNCYSETEEDWDRYREEMKTGEEKANDTAKKRQQEAIARAEALLNDPEYEKKIKLRQTMTKCPICSEKIVRSKKSKQVGGEFDCPYCRARFRLVSRFDFEGINMARAEKCFIIKR